MRIFIIFSLLILAPCMLFSQTEQEDTDTIAPASTEPAATDGFKQSDNSRDNKVKKIKASRVESISTDNTNTQLHYSKQQLKDLENQSALLRTQRSPSLEQQKNMLKLVGELENAAPQSFEYNLYKYISGNYNVKLFSHLQKAEEIRPKNSEVLIQLVGHYESVSKKKETKKYLKKLFQTNRISKDLIPYAEDVLFCMKKNGILITHGVEDTYAIRYAQLVNGVRTDVQVVSLELLQGKSYRKKIASEGLKLPNSTFINTSYLQQLCRLNKDQILALSLSIPKEYFKAIKNNLYVVGLTMFHTELPCNNFYLNDVIWNTEMKKKILSLQTTKANSLKANYLPMLLVLRANYLRNGEKQNAKELDKTIDKIAAESNQYSRVQQMKAKQ